VFRANEDGTVSEVPVVLGARRPGWVELTEGVKAGDRIVVEGIVKLRDGAKFAEVGSEAPKNDHATHGAR
jgi:membrane fusion protein (multidrug efflux system)